VLIPTYIATADLFGFADPWPFERLLVPFFASLLHASADALLLSADEVYLEILAKDRIGQPQEKP
jgi:hypothetical protein